MSVCLFCVTITYNNKVVAFGKVEIKLSFCLADLDFLADFCLPNDIELNLNVGYKNLR